MKKCTKCKSEQDLSKFSKDRTKPDGLHPHCKTCRFNNHKSYYSKNKKEILTYKKQWDKDNRDQKLAYSREYDKLNKESISIKKKEHAKTENYKKSHAKAAKKWYDKNKKKVLEYNKQNRPLVRKRIRQATPKWLTKEQKQEIKDIYKSCRAMSEFHEEQFHVDHIEPINGKTSSGLNVPWNLRIIPALDNLRKSNKLIN